MGARISGAWVSYKELRKINPEAARKTVLEYLEAPRVGVHAGGAASLLSPATPYFGGDVAIDIEIATRS